MYAETIGSRLRLYIDQGDDREGRTLWGAIVELVRTEGLAGVTVSGGMEGIGADHLASIPVVIEVVDEPDHIARLPAEHLLRAGRRALPGGELQHRPVRVAHQLVDGVEGRSIGRDA